MNNLSSEQTRRHVVLPLLVLLAAAAAAMVLIKTRPKAEHRPPAEIVALVSILEAAPSTETIVVPAMGTVLPSVQVELQAEVSGRVVAQHPRLIPGARVLAGETLVKLDAADYEYALDQQKAALDKATFDLKVERGRKKIAEEEWRRLGPEMKADADARSLALREPHLKAAESAVESAKSALSLARLNLDRTAVRSPFDAVILEKHTDIGQLVSPQSRIATLAGVESGWVRVSIPVETLRWIRLPDRLGAGGSAAKVIQDVGQGEPLIREGRVIRLLADLDSAGRMARLLVRVEHPFDTKEGLPLLLGAYVKVEIDGIAVEGVCRLPRAALRDGSQVWIMGDGDRLEIRPVEVAWGEETESLVRGLQPGDRVVVSPLALPVAGMKLRVEVAPEAAAEPAPGETVTGE